MYGRPEAARNRDAIDCDFGRPQRAAHLVDRVLPDVPIRQWVLSVPYRLRHRLAWDHDLCRALAGILVRSIFRVLRDRARDVGVEHGRGAFRPGDSPSSPGPDPSTGSGSPRASSRGEGPGLLSECCHSANTTLFTVVNGLLLRSVPVRDPGPHVLGLVMRESMLLVSVGVAIGLAIALAAGRFVRALLFGLAPTDGLSITAAVAIMLCVSGAAAYLPARRASRIDPLAALRQD